MAASRRLIVFGEAFVLSARRLNSCFRNFEVRFRLSNQLGLSISVPQLAEQFIHTGRAQLFAL